MHPSVTLPTLFSETGSFTEPGACCYGKTSHLPASSLLPAPPPPEVQAHITVPIFFVGAGNLNSGSSACIANTLPTEQSST